jgi:hypothetical protein
VSVFDPLRTFGAAVMFAGMDNEGLEREEELHTRLERSRMRSQRGRLAMAVIDGCVASACGLGLLFNSIRGGAATTGLLLTAMGGAALMDLKRRATAPDA